MELDQATADRLTLNTVSELRVEGLIRELTRRVMVVQPDALQHLVDRGVLARFAADGCCKPDGGTCCPNKKLVVDKTVGPENVR